VFDKRKEEREEMKTPLLFSPQLGGIDWERCYYFIWFSQ
jgi:hypothetical protein